MTTPCCIREVLQREKNVIKGIEKEIEDIFIEHLHKQARSTMTCLDAESCVLSKLFKDKVLSKIRDYHYK